jgi:hypothetical protein
MGSKVISRGTHKQKKQTFDLISLLSVLESKLKISNIPFYLNLNPRDKIAQRKWRTAL